MALSGHTRVVSLNILLSTLIELTVGMANLGSMAKLYADFPISIYRFSGLFVIVNVFKHGHRLEG